MRIVRTYTAGMIPESPDTSAVTLSTLPTGRRARITRITGPRNVRHRLLGLGLHPGGLLTIVQRRSRGLVVAVGAARVALGNDMATHLRVEALG